MPFIVELDILGTDRLALRYQATRWRKRSDSAKQLLIFSKRYGSPIEAHLLMKIAAATKYVPGILNKLLHPGILLELGECRRKTSEIHSSNLMQKIALTTNRVRMIEALPLWIYGHLGVPRPPHATPGSTTNVKSES